MDKEDRRILMLGQLAEALIEAMGMLAYDLWEIKFGNGQVHVEASYTGLIEKHGIHHNAIISCLRD
jgi:hypothetical protein